MSITGELQKIRKELPSHVKLVAVSKFHPTSAIKEAYDEGQRIFGESRVQEILLKQKLLPDDISWHFIGHLQTNKVKHIIPFVDMIESVDSLRLLQEINECAAKLGRVIKVLLQIHIATEENKFGFSDDECKQLLLSEKFKLLPYIHVSGLMGMATFTENTDQIRTEFSGLASLFNKIKREIFTNDPLFSELSMGMSDDYPIAIEEGSTLVRIGSKIFGTRE